MIVGIGRDSFSKMIELDADRGALRDGRGITAIRDVVQFVPFRKFAGNSYALSREVLAEIPKQLVSYMKLNGIEPTN